jgi:hypothetical protein
MPATQPQPAEQQPTETKGKGGAPKGSSNGRRHGLRMGALMPGVPHIGRDLNAVRRSLEAAVLALRGVVSVQDALTINAVVRFERKLRLCERHLALKGDEMASETYLAFERESARWLLDRDRAAASLGLRQETIVGLWPLVNGHEIP